MKNIECKLAIIIINYKTPQLVKDCMESLIPELSNLSAKVIIVDNDSNDNSCQKLQDWIKNHNVESFVSLIASPDNTGFSGGNNMGIEHVEADFYLLLNSDTVIKRGAIHSLLNAAEMDDKAGLISPKLEWPDAKPQISCFKFHTPISELIFSARTGLITKLFKSFNVPQGVSDKKAYYDWTSFACVLIKSAVFKDLGLMDEGYFMYYEDVNFCYRAKKLNWKVLNVPNAHIVHLRGGSSPVKSQAKLRKRLPRYFYESRSRCFYQCYGQLGLFMANILWTIGWLFSILRSLFSSSFHPSGSEHKWKDIWINFLNPLKPYLHPKHYDKT